ncbi:MAG: CHASE2 domain-containing protein, partial [Gaiellaceae bacterium]
MSDRFFSTTSGASATERLFRGLSLVAALVAVALLLGARFGGVLDEAELATVDTRFDLRGETAPPPELLIVEIDDKTFEELNLQWPFPRGIHADLIDLIAADRPAAIVYDVQFTEPTDAQQDNELITAVADAGSVVLATTEVDEEGGTGVFGGLPLAELGARAGSALFASDPGGVVRKISYDVERLPTVAVAAAETVTGRSVEREARGEEWIDFHGGPGSIPTISFSDALLESEAGAFSDRIVVVGASAPTLKDLHTTSTSSGEFMAGPELEAHAISTVLRDFPLRSSSRAVDIVLLVALGLLPALLARRFALRWLVPTAAVVVVFYLVAVQLAFNGGVVLPVLYPLVALALATVAVVGLTATAARLEHERARALFARFVPAEVVDDVLLQADDDLRLGNVELDGTALFVDLRAFTPFVETHGPEDVLRVLNQYLETTSNAI